MKALTLYRPWPWSILKADPRKTIENRSWRPPATILGQRLALHAGKTYQDEAVEHMEAIGLVPPTVWADPRGIVGVVTVGGYVVRRDGGLYAVYRATRAGGISGVTREPRPDCEPWWIGPFGWIMAEPVALPRPVFCNGKQGLWNLPPEVEAEVVEQLREMSQ